MSSKIANIRLWIESGIRDPIAAWGYLLGGDNRIDILRQQRLSQILGISEDIAHGYLEEYNSLSELHEHIEEECVRGGYDLRSLFCPELYVIARHAKPKTIVETGVFAGISTSYILAALEANRSGNLYSIDLPGADPTANLPKGKAPGWMIPESLKKGWTLLVGSSGTLLENLLRELVDIDVFFHDSEHSYDNMIHEFSTSWPHLGVGKLLIADNILANDAFIDFSKGKNARKTFLWCTKPYKACLGVLKRLDPSIKLSHAKCQTTI